MFARPKAAILLSLALTAIAVGLAGWGESGGTQSSHKPQVGIVTLHAGPVSLTTELPGRVDPYAISEVRPQVSGIILKRLFTEGSTVKAGQVLYQIDPRPYQATYNNAAAALAAAKAKADRYGKLVQDNAIAPQTYDDALAAYKQAAATAQSARIDLDYTTIKAPISGRIGISSVTQGALVTTNQAAALTTVQTLDPVYVDIVQSSTQLLALKQAITNGHVDARTPDQTDVSLRLEDGTLYPLKGKLQFTDVTVDPATGSVTLRAIFPNPNHLLLPGMYVRAELSEGTNPHAILAPQQGVTRDLRGEPNAYVLDAGNKIVERSLTIARAIGNQWLVTSGLKDGDRLVVEGTQKIRPGMEVEPVTVSLSGSDGGAKPANPKPDPQQKP